MKQNTAKKLSIDSTPVPENTPQAWPQRRWYKAYDQTDLDAVAAIRRKYGLATDEDAVRLALRLVAGDAIKVSPPPAAQAKQAAKVVVRFRLRGQGS